MIRPISRQHGSSTRGLVLRVRTLLVGLQRLNPLFYSTGPGSGIVLRAPLIENCALVRNTSRGMFNSSWTLREIETKWDELQLDVKVVELFPVIREVVSESERNGKVGGNREI